MKNEKNVVWAVDLGAKDKKTIVATRSVLKGLFGRKRTIYPAYLAASDELRFPKELLEKDTMIGRLPILERAAQLMKPVTEPNVAPLAVVRSKGVYLHAAVDSLVDFARSRSADLIVLNTHSRNGVSRFWMGSFAETMMLHSPIPVLIINPNLKRSSRFNNVFFPTDFSAGSLSIFNQVVELAAELKLKIVIYHRLETYHEMIGMPLEPSAYYKIYRREVLRAREESLAGMVATAAARGVKAESLLSERGNSLTEDILARSGRMASTLLAMSAQSGSLASALVGSTTRQVVRGARCPVWVLHARTQTGK